MPDRTIIWETTPEKQPVVYMTKIPDSVRLVDLMTEEILRWNSLLGEWVPASDIKYVEVETIEEHERNQQEP